MTVGIDANVLLAAFHTGADHHDACNRCVERLLREGRVALAWPTLSAFLRITTNRRIYAAPQTPQAAEAVIERLVSHANVTVLSEGEGFWRSYRAITARVDVRGALVPDAHLAALLKEHDVRVLCTRDRGFRVFDHLEVKDPVDE